MRAEEFSIECDGAFFLYEQAQGEGRYPHVADAQEHVRDCAECWDLGNEEVLHIDEWDDTPIPG